MILTAMGKGGNGGQMYPDFVGRRAIFVGSGTGPVSSSNTVGDPVSLAVPNWYIDAVLDGSSIDGLYYVQAFPTGTGPRQTINLFYFTKAGAPVTPGTNLSGSTFVISAFVGQY
jgi:hypothetical protein